MGRRRRLACLDFPRLLGSMPARTALAGTCVLLLVISAISPVTGDRGFFGGDHDDSDSAVAQVDDTPGFGAFGIGAFSAMADVAKAAAEKSAGGVMGAANVAKQAAEASAAAAKKASDAAIRSAEIAKELAETAASGANDVVNSASDIANACVDVATGAIKVFKDIAVIALKKLIKGVVQPIVTMINKIVRKLLKPFKRMMQGTMTKFMRPTWQRLHDVFDLKFGVDVTVKGVSLPKLLLNIGLKIQEPLAKLMNVLAKQRCEIFGMVPDPTPTKLCP